MPFLVAAQVPSVSLSCGVRHRGAHHVGRLGGDDRGRGVHHHHELLRLGRDVAGRERVRRQHEARQDVDLVAHHQFLREALGHVRRDAADVLADELDLLAGDRVAVLLHVELDAVVDLVAGVGELARIGQDHADLDGVLRHRRRHGGQDRLAISALRIVSLPVHVRSCCGGNFSHEGGRGRIQSDAAVGRKVGQQPTGGPHTRLTSGACAKPQSVPGARSLNPSMYLPRHMMRAAQRQYDGSNSPPRLSWRQALQFDDTKSGRHRRAAIGIVINRTPNGRRPR